MRALRPAIVLLVGFFVVMLPVAAGHCESPQFTAELLEFEQAKSPPAEVISQYEKLISDLKELGDLGDTKFLALYVDLNSSTKGLFVRVETPALCSAGGQCPTDLYDVSTKQPRRLLSVIAQNIALQTGGDIVAAPGEQFPNILTNIPPDDVEAHTNRIINPTAGKLWKWNGEQYKPTKWQ